jgi:diacylglycerol kinase family enzyme
VTSLLVVTNASAGTTDDDRVDAALSVLRSGADVTVRSCAEPGDLDAVLDGGLDGRTLVLVGGDGSVHTAVGRLRARGGLDPDRPVGIVPLGTGNDLARTLGIPLDPADAARALLAGRTRRLDLGVDDDGGGVVKRCTWGWGPRRRNGRAG